MASTRLAGYHNPNAGLYRFAATPTLLNLGSIVPVLLAALALAWLALPRRGTQNQAST